MKRAQVIGGALLGLGVAAVVAILNKDPRDKVISIALTQLGEQDPDKYWADVQPALMGNPHTIAWCGGFVLWVLRQAGLTDAKWEIGKGFASKLLRLTDDPKPGDMAYFDHLQHHAIVKSVDGDNIVTIDGNQSPGERVTEKFRKRGEVTAFYSIEPLLKGSA